MALSQAVSRSPRGGTSGEATRKAVGKTWTAEPDQIIPRGTIPYLSLSSKLQGLI